MMQPIILAAGKGTRMGSELPKVLVQVGGKPMLAYVFEALQHAGNCEKPIVVVGYKGDQVRDYAGQQGTCVEQIELTGTATAVKSALPAVPTSAAKVFIMYGDNPFITPASVQTIEQAHDAADATLTLATARVDDFQDWRAAFASFGRIVRDPKGEVSEIVEYKNATEHERSIREINPGFYCIDRVWLAQAIERVAPNPVTGEYYLTDILSLAIDDEKRVTSILISPEEALGVNSPADAAQAESILKK